MNVEMVNAHKFAEARQLIEQGGEKVAEGIAMLLISKADYAADNTASNGVNAGEVLSKAIKLFQDNPYMAIGLSGKTGLQATESDIKKSFRKYALKYHPDKTQNKTGLMFTVIQQAYATLSDPEKRKRHDERARRAAEKLEKMRKMKETEDRRRRQEGHMDEKFGKHGKSSDTRPPPVSTNSFRQPPQSQEEAEYRAFNKRFYEDFRRKMGMNSYQGKSPHKPRPPQGAPPVSKESSSDANKPSDKHRPGPATPDQKKPVAPPSKRQDQKKKFQKAPSKPRGLRATSRSDTTVTLEWRHGAGGQGDSTAYELQWRARGQRLVEWETSTQLILGTTCRKKNLVPSTCYEFRVRAASAWGWSGYGDPVMVVTNAMVRDVSQEKRGDSSSAKGGAADAKPAPRAPQPPSGGNGVAPRKKGPPSKDLHKVPGVSTSNYADTHAGTNWMCVVCKRSNGPDQPTCSVCYTKRSYRASKLNNIQHTESTKAPTGYKKSVGENKDGGGDTDTDQYPNDVKENRKRPQSARSRPGGVPSNDRGYHSVDGGGGMHGHGGDESEEEYGDEAWEFSETDVHDDNPFSEFQHNKSAASPRSSFQVGDVVVASGLTATQYNGLVGEVRSALMEGRYQVELRLNDGSKKNIRIKPANLRLKRRKSSSSSTSSQDGRSEAKKAFSTPEKGQQQRTQQRDVEGGDGYGFNGSRARMGYEGAGFPKIYWLNTAVTKLHNVRSEPIKESTIVGHLKADKQVLAMAEAGDWLKVEWHSAYDGNSNKAQPSKSGAGWCLVSNAAQRYLIEDTQGGVGADTCDPGDFSSSSEAEAAVGWESDYAQSGADGEDAFGMEDMEEVIYELRDESGGLYYFNGATGVSCWDPPEWIDTTDPVSGAVYYENTLSGETQWDKPWDFIPVVREEAYSTPEAQFIKSVLSPKRSRGPRNFYSPGEA